MGTYNDPLKARFHLNMSRINSLVRLLCYDFDQVKPTGLFKSSGTRADILRAIIVFLHATFEDVLRSQLPKPNKNLSFYSHTDIDKALKLSGIDAKPFKPLYPPLTQMAKRRKRIVHQADLAAHTTMVSEVWGIVDDWQLIMWLMAVPAFYYQLRMSTGVAHVVERTMYERYRMAMMTHVDFGHQLLAFPTVPHELRIEALRKSVITLNSIIDTMKLDVSDFIVNKG